MIKTKVNNEYKDIVGVFGGGTLQKEIIKIWSREAGTYVYESSVEYTGTLPITITANGNALIDYQIYGADGGVGEGTENIYSGYIKQGYYDFSNGNYYAPWTTYIAQRWVCTDLIPCAMNTDYAIRMQLEQNLLSRYYGFVFFDENQNFLRSSVGKVLKNPITFVANTGNAKYMAFNAAGTTDTTEITPEDIVNSTLTEGSTAPTSYIPYGYKLPIVISDQNLLPDNISQFNNGYITPSGSISTPDATKKEKYSDYVSIVPNTSYTFAMANGFPGNPSGNIDANPWRTIAFYRQNKTFINREPIDTTNAIKPNPFTVTSPSDAFFVRVTWRSFGSEECPVLVTNRNIYPVYIGENQLDSVEGVSDYVDKASDKIVRMIGEYTFTGDESFNKYGNSDVFYTSKTIDPVGITTVNTITMRCNHPAFTAIENKDTRYWLNPEADDICCFLPGGRSQVFFRSTSNFTTAAECEAYLKAQYDNGTPVKISYWLKTPVEEDPPVPFPDIPTINGKTVIDYDGDQKPSQMYVKYRR